MRIVIRHLSGSDVGRADVFETEPTDAKTVVLGRDQQCDVRFDLQRDIEVSSRHAELVPKDDQVEVVDLGSTNGTWLNGAEVDRALVESGDILELGNGGPKLRVLIRRGFWQDLRGWFRRRTGSNRKKSRHDRHQ